MYVVFVVSEANLTMRQEGQLSILFRDVYALSDIRQEKCKVRFQHFSDVPFVEWPYDVADLGFLAIEREVEGLDAKLVHDRSNNVLFVREIHDADAGHLLSSDLHQQVVLLGGVLSQAGHQVKQHQQTKGQKLSH